MTYDINHLLTLLDKTIYLPFFISIVMFSTVYFVSTLNEWYLLAFTLTLEAQLFDLKKIFFKDSNLGIGLHISRYVSGSKASGFRCSFDKD